MTRAGHRIKFFFDGLYWLGIVATLACLALILTGNSAWGYEFEHARLPLSWVLGGTAVAAFLAAETCHPTIAAVAEDEDDVSLLAQQCEEVEA